MQNTVNAKRLACLAGLVCAAGVAFAQNGEAAPNRAGEPREIQGDFDRPLEGGHGAGEFRSHTVMKLSQMENNTTYTLTIEDGKKSAEIDGKPIPSERIREKNGKVEILDPAGNVLTTFNTGNIKLEMGQPRVRSFTGGRGANQDVFRIAPLPGVDEPAPPVMLGITMSSDDAGGVTVDRVVPGLPAEKAGLKEGDVILKFDGQDVATPEGLRASLKDKKAGEEIALRVRRDGKEQDLKVTLAPFNAKELGVNDQAAMVVRPFMDEAEQAMDDAKRAVEQALEKVKAIDTGKIRTDVEDALNKALASMEKAQAGARERGQRWVELLNQGGPRMLMGDGEQQMFVVPGQPNIDDQQLRDMIQEHMRALNMRQDQDGDAADTIDRMNRQMERLMDRLERMEKRLEEAEKRP